jgi:transcriptional regulator with XRE-family HTH domain
VKFNFNKISPIECSYRTLPEVSFPLLLPLTPYGTGTGEVEAISSYMCRQAELLCERPHPLVKRIIYRKNGLNSDCKNTRYPSKGLYTCNGSQVIAKKTFENLNTLLDGYINSKYLTYLPLSNITDKNCRGLSRQNKAWCPECWRSDVANDKTPYIRLYWTSDLVSICCIHNCRLSEFCHCCGETNSVVPIISKQWHCEHCGADLTTEDIESSIGNFKSEQGWISHSIFQLIYRVYANKLNLTQETVAGALRHLLKVHSLTEEQFALRLNINRRMVNNLLFKKAKPYLPAFLDMCYRLDIPPDQLLFTRDVLSDQGLWLNIDKQIFVHSTKITDKKKKLIYSAMQRTIRENPVPPIRVSHFSRKYEIRYSALDYHFPEEYRILRRRWTDWDTKNRSSAHTDRLQNISQAVFNLVRNGIYPSDRKLKALAIVKASDLRREDVISLLRILQDIFCDLNNS